jgi:hypothetical protein
MYSKYLNDLARTSVPHSVIAFPPQICFPLPPSYLSVSQPFFWFAAPYMTKKIGGTP